MKKEIFVFKPCKTKAAFQANLKNSVNLDMKKIKEILSNNNYKIELFIEDLIIAKKEKYVINVFKDGKIILRDEKNKEKAKKIIKEVYEKINI